MWGTVTDRNFKFVIRRAREALTKNAKLSQSK